MAPFMAEAASRPGATNIVYGTVWPSTSRPPTSWLSPTPIDNR